MYMIMTMMIVTHILCMYVCSGGAAVVLSNRWFDGYRASFKLLTVQRTHYISPESYECVYETQDEEGHRGVRLSKDIVKVAGRALERNLTTLGPYVLPMSEQLATVMSMAVRFLFKQITALTGVKLPKLEPYIPSFARGIDHFCIHAGGRGVIDGIEKNLKLTPEQVAASRYALHTYGNTSSSSIWYEMDYIRKQADLHTGQRVLQIAFGSGFKCNSAVWLCINNTRATVMQEPRRSGRDRFLSMSGEDLDKQLDADGYLKTARRSGEVPGAGCGAGADASAAAAKESAAKKRE